MSQAKEVLELHRNAMLLYTGALELEHSGKVVDGFARKILAFMFEKKAAMLLVDAFDKEPTRSILFRSAATIGVQLGFLLEAKALIAHGLAGNPPGEIKNELEQLLPQKQLS